MNPEELASIRELLDSLPADFRVMEQGISQAVLEEYYKKGLSIEGDNKDLVLATQEEWESLSLEDLKTLLSALATTADVKSYRRIEEILKVKADELGSFGYVTLMYARMKLESQLTDTAAGFILSGLGGKGNKLRYYFVLMSHEAITEARARFVEGEILEVCKERDSELEELERQENYLLIRILVSVEQAIGDLIEDVILQCPFLAKEFICTNVEKPTHDFILRWINNELDWEEQEEE